MKTIILTIIILFLFAPALSQNKMTDAELDGFRGKVKTVIKEDSELVQKNGKLVEMLHQMNSKESYDNNGNVTERLHYDGNSRETYIFIDGDRTIKSSQIKKEKFNGIRSAVPEMDKSKPRDKRYDLKLKYDYDSQGRVKEEKKFSNNGQLFISIIYKYDENGRLKQEDNYSYGKLNDITIYKYDEKGNVIERKFTLTAIKGEDDTRIYNFSDYKLDATGNWTKRIETSSEKFNGKSTLKKIVHYQKIIYYEN
jgi:hypothetical protein